MQRFGFVLCLGLLCWGTGSSSLWAQADNALLEVLVRKGVITEADAHEIRNEAELERSKQAANKLELSKDVTKLKIYGKARWRYQWNEASTQTPVSPNPGTAFGVFNPSPQEIFDQSRARYAFWLGAQYDYSDTLRGGIEFASGDNNDSYNQTIGSGFGRFNFGLSLLYLQWDTYDWLTLTAGKQRNPLETTSLVWDSDIRPEGLTEEFYWDLNDAFSIGVTLGQWVYSAERDPTINDFLPFNTDDDMIWMFVAQVPMEYRFMEYETVTVPSDDPKDSKGGYTTTKAKEVVSVGLAPGFMTYLGGSTEFVNTGSPGFEDPFGSNNLNVVTAPGYVKWKAWKAPMKFFWDFAYNLTGEERVQEQYLRPLNAAGVAFASQNTDLTDNLAWLVGFKVGSNKKVGDWAAGVDFRTVGVGSVDPNLNDSNFGLGQLNQQGFKVKAAYNLTDSIIGSVTYFNTWNYKKDLFFPVNPGGAPIVAGNGNGRDDLVGVNGTQIVQFDLQWKF